MNVEIGIEAAQFLEKEYINGIFVAVYTLEFEERKIITISRKPFLPCCDWKQKVNTSFLISKKFLAHPTHPKRVFVSYIC